MRTKPDMIIVFRDGVADSQFEHVVSLLSLLSLLPRPPSSPLTGFQIKHEIPQVQAACAVPLNYLVRLPAFLTLLSSSRLQIVQKRIHSKFTVQKSTTDVGNPPAGTLIKSQFGTSDYFVRLGLPSPRYPPDLS